MLPNINMVFNGRNDAIKCIADYVILDAEKKQLKVKGLKHKLLHKCFKDYQCLLHKQKQEISQKVC